jgi:hypothetical protein
MRYSPFRPRGCLSRQTSQARTRQTTLHVLPLPMWELARRTRSGWVSLLLACSVPRCLVDDESTRPRTRTPPSPASIHPHGTRPRADRRPTHTRTTMEARARQGKCDGPDGPVPSSSDVASGTALELLVPPIPDLTWVGIERITRAKMPARCLHETDFTLAPGIATEHPFFPQLEQCFKSNPLDRTAFVSMKGASRHPCTCRLALARL